MDTVDLGVFECRRGDAFTLVLLGEENATGALVNLASYGPLWSSQVRRRSIDPSPAAVFAVDVSNIGGAVNPAHDAPQLTLTLTGVQTALLTPGTYRFDVQVTGGAQSPLTLYAGELQVVQDITHA